jgi:hypothetical protein
MEKTLGNTYIIRTSNGDVYVAKWLKHKRKNLPHQFYAGSMIMEDDLTVSSGGFPFDDVLEFTDINNIQFTENT